MLRLDIFLSSLSFSYDRKTFKTVFFQMHTSLVDKASEAYCHLNVYIQRQHFHIYVEISVGTVKTNFHYSENLLIRHWAYLSLQSIWECLPAKYNQVLINCCYLSLKCNVR